MKTKLLAALFLITSIGASAHEIQGTLMLKGSLKTKIMVNTVKTVCKIKIEKVRNLLEEDSFGNPGYQVQIQLSLDGSDVERNLKVKLSKEVTVQNMHGTGNARKIDDLNYFNAAEKVKVVITEEGRLVSTSFPFEQQMITCKF